MLKEDWYYVEGFRKPYRCGHCNKAYKRPGDLDIHLFYWHKLRDYKVVVSEKKKK